MFFLRVGGKGQGGENTGYNQVTSVQNLPIYLCITQYRGPHKNDIFFLSFFSLIRFPDLLPKETNCFLIVAIHPHST